MRTLFIIPLVLSLVSFPSWGLTMGDLVVRERVYYEKFTSTPFTGEVDEGLERGSFESGKRQGEWVAYDPNGQLSYKGSFKNGRTMGNLSVKWFSNLQSFLQK